MGGRGGGSPATGRVQGPRGPRASAAPTAASTAITIGDQVIAAYRSLANRPNELVSLVRLRAALGDIGREDLDRTLKAMDRSRMIQLSPDPNQKALPAQARRDAVSLGGSDQHFISIG